jgi:hypothetical protein
MPRPLRRAAVFVAVLALSAPVSAQPADPLELARGLREHGMADLALEYLDQLAGGKLSPALATVLPLERARARLELAEAESDYGKRDAVIAEARAEFEQFLKANANHPRRSEAAVSLARVVSAQARAAVSRANRIDDRDQRKAALAKARPVFEDAATRFAQAATAYAARLDDPTLTPAQRRDATRDVYQTELDRAINAFLLATTYDPSEGVKEIEARGNALKQARGLFKQLGDRDEGHPLCWVARAWVGECDREMDSAVEARKQFDAIKDAARRNPAAADGARLVRFFEARAEFLSAGRDPNALRKAQAALEQWLADPAHRTARPNPEVHAARWYIAYARHQQALALIREDPKTKQPVVPPSAQTLLRQAERDYRRVTETENEYSDRAAERRTQVIRLLVGDADVDPAKLFTFDEAAMAAQVKLYRAIKEAEKPEERTDLMRKAAALFERARELPATADSTRDLLDAEVNLVFAYLAAGEPHRAAILGEHLARTARPSGPAARAGLYAVQAYIQAAADLDPTDSPGRRVDQHRAVRVAQFLDQRYPTDSSTDAARVQVAQFLMRDGRHREAFDMLTRVNPGYPRVAAARLLQGGAAFELLRRQDTDEDEPAFTPPQRAAVYARTVADLSAVAPPPPNAPADDVRVYVLLGLQLADLHLAIGPDGYAKAEKAAADAAARVESAGNLAAEDKQELSLLAEHARERALYAQAVQLYRADKYAEAVAKIAPALAAAKDGPAVRDGQPELVAAAARKLDEFRRDSLLVVALQSRIRAGEVEKVGELFDLMKSLGGSLDAGVTALGQLIAATRPQADALRRQGRDEEADRLVRGVGAVLDRVAAEPDLTPQILLFLGTGLKDMGDFDRAVEMLAKVPAPPADDLSRRPSDLDEKARPAVQLYRQARLETARAHRLAGRFDDADRVLTEAMGTAENPGWAATSPDFRREVAYLLEDRAAAAADPQQAIAFWGAARGKWTELANDFVPTLRKLAAGKQDTTSAVLALADLKALPPHKLLPQTPEEIRKGLSDPKPPRWVTELLTETVPGQDGEPQANPIAQEYVRALRNTVTRMEAQIKPQYHALFFESIRCLTRANTHLLRDRPNDLQRTLARIASDVRQLEASNPDLSPEVRAKFASLMEEYPQLKQEYDRTTAGPVAVAPAAESSENGRLSPRDASELTETDTTNSTVPTREEGDGFGLIIGGMAGLVAVIAVVTYFVLFRRPLPPARRTAPVPRFDDQEA